MQFYVDTYSCIENLNEVHQQGNVQFSFVTILILVRLPQRSRNFQEINEEFEYVCVLRDKLVRGTYKSIIYHSLCI